MLLPVAVVILAAAAVPLACHALALQQSQPSSSSSSSCWRPLPHVDRRQVLASGVLLTTATALASSGSPRSVASVDSHVAVPLWPTWGGGRVVPISLGGPLQDPFLLLAHHKHWFDPRDPLRGPFKMAGKALGLPYVDVEGFSMHPHRGLDILTYVLDGSDGFRHRDSLGDGSRVYRGGCAQWMRTGSGVLHEEFWETRPDRRTDIELFQLWINLPASQKLDEPVIRYIGATTEDPWLEHHEAGNGVRVRDVGATLDACLDKQEQQGNGANESVRGGVARRRPPVTIRHVTLQPGTQWVAPAPPEHSALLYVREGTATLSPDHITKTLQTATFRPDGDHIVIQNAERRNTLDLLLLTAAPLREPVAWGGPIVMNTQQELDDAFRQLSNGTFLKRNVALKEHKETVRRAGQIV